MTKWFWLVKDRHCATSFCGSFKSTVSHWVFGGPEKEFGEAGSWLAYLPREAWRDSSIHCPNIRSTCSEVLPPLIYVYTGTWISSDPPKRECRHVCCAFQVYAQKETCSEELGVERQVRKGLQLVALSPVSTPTELSGADRSIDPKPQHASGISFNKGPRLHLLWGSTMYHIDDLPFGTDHLPDVYTQFRKACILLSIATVETSRNMFANEIRNCSLSNLNAGSEIA